MSVRQGTQIALCAGLVLMFAGCGSSATEDESSAGSGGSNIPVVGNYPSAANAGQNGLASGFKGWRNDAAAGSSGASGMKAAAGGGAGSAGSAGAAGAAGNAAAGSGSAGAAGNAGAAGAAGDASQDDPLDLFGSGGSSSATSTCEGMICVEDRDCQDLYPDENARCKFTRCEEFECK